MWRRTGFLVLISDSRIIPLAELNWTILFTRIPGESVRTDGDITRDITRGRVKGRETKGWQLYKPMAAEPCLDSSEERACFERNFGCPGKNGAKQLQANIVPISKENPSSKLKSHVYSKGEFTFEEIKILQIVKYE